VTDYYEKIYSIEVSLSMVFQKLVRMA